MCYRLGGGEIATWLVSSSVKRAGAIHLFQKGEILSECYELVSTSADDWSTKGLAMCFCAYVILHVKDPQRAVVNVGHRVPLAGLSVAV